MMDDAEHFGYEPHSLHQFPGHGACEKPIQQPKFFSATKPEISEQVLSKGFSYQRKPPILSGNYKKGQNPTEMIMAQFKINPNMNGFNISKSQQSATTPLGDPSLTLGEQKVSTEALELIAPGDLSDRGGKSPLLSSEPGISEGHNKGNILSSSSPFGRQESPDVLGLSFIPGETQNHTLKRKLPVIGKETTIKSFKRHPISSVVEPHFSAAAGKKKHKTSPEAIVRVRSSKQLESHSTPKRRAELPPNYPPINFSFGKSSPGSICADLEQPSHRIQRYLNPKDASKFRQSRGSWSKTDESLIRERSRSQASNISKKRSKITNSKAVRSSHKPRDDRKKHAIRYIAHGLNDYVEIANQERTLANEQIEQLQNDAHR